jgi:hypothetical protein
MSVDENLMLEDEPGPEAGRPDPLFKLLTREEAERLGLEASESELQFSPRADLILTVRPGLALENTMFDFFRSINVLEFKGEGDRFNLREYIKNDVRTSIKFLQEKAEDFENILNVIVCSRMPQGFLNAAKKRGVPFQPEPDKPWLWRGQVGFQNVAIIICIELPLEERYHRWLVFAPSDSRKWQAYIFELLERGDLPMLEVAEQLRPKEFHMLTKNFEEILALAAEASPKDPEYQAEARKTRIEAAITLLEAVANKQKEDLGKLLSRLKPEDRLTGLSSEERLAGLAPEDRLTGLAPEEREKLLKLLLEEAKTEPKQKQQEN